MPSYREELISQIPAAQLLINLGYDYLPPDQALALRDGRERNVVLTDILEPWLREHNRFTYKGEQHRFSQSALTEAIRRLTDISLNDGLTHTNERIYEILTLGISLPQTIQGDTRHYSLRFIDWDNPENNVYHVTEEFVVERERSHKTRRPDLVCFVNGIPFVVIECKRPDLNVKDGGLPHEEAISQMLRNQKEGEIRPLFAYAQVLMAVSTNHAAYATTETPKKFWSIWKEEQDEAHAGRVQTLINTALDENLLPDFYAWRKNSYWVRQAFQEKATACPPSRTAPSSGCSTLPACWNWSTNSSSTMGVRRKSPATSNTLPSKRPSTVSPHSMPRASAPAGSSGTPPARANRSPWSCWPKPWCSIPTSRTRASSWSPTGSTWTLKSTRPSPTAARTSFKPNQAGT